MRDCEQLLARLTQCVIPQCADCPVTFYVTDDWNWQTFLIGAVFGILLFAVVNHGWRREITKEEER